MFSGAKCGHCNGTSSKAAEISPSGATYKQTAICCSSCNAILGVTGYYDTGTLLKKAEEERAAMARKIQNLEHMIGQIANAMQYR